MGKPTEIKSHSSGSSINPNSQVTEKNRSNKGVSWEKGKKLKLADKNYTV